MDLRKIQNKERSREKRKILARRFRTAFFAIFLTTILTTVGVFATNNFENFSESTLSSAISGTGKVCEEGMTLVSASGGGFCIDMYENSANKDCLFENPKNENETMRNLENSLCRAVSVENAMPWTNVARHQAERLCANEGKHLPSNEEWYQASLGTPDSKANVERKYCNVSSGEVNFSGENTRCISSYGAFDMVGNIWEWVSETVVEGGLNGRELPSEGYVTSIDTSGVPITTNASSSDIAFNEDYLWVEEAGVRGMIRGGYFGNGTDAGQYAINAITPTSFTGSAVGFRCAK